MERIVRYYLSYDVCHKIERLRHLISRANTNFVIMQRISGRKVLLVLMAFAIALSLAISSGMPAIAENLYIKKIDLRGDAVDQEGNAVPDLDIHHFGFAGTKAYIQVDGTAGGTLADHEHAIAYVINILTATGEMQTWAIDSHEKQHGDTGTGEEWHAHRVVVGDNPNTEEDEGPFCVNEVDEVNHATMQEHRVIFENMVVRGKTGNLETVDTVAVLSALTVELHVLVDDPDHPGDAPCIAEISWPFDDA